MGQDYKKEARKQYFKFFSIWFIVTGCLLLIGGAVLVGSMLKPAGYRKNYDAPDERVYDYADVLTDEEEDDLRDYIEECEDKVKIDIVLVTIAEDMEDGGSWESNMMNYADDFYDENEYGYNKVHGDGVLLLDNWYEDQEGSWLSTCGSVYEEFGNYEIDRVLDVVYNQVETNPYKAYTSYVSTVTNYMTNAGSSVHIPWLFVVLAPIVVAVIFALINLSQKPAKDTTTASTYVTGGRPNMNVCTDDFIRKNVVTRRIQSNSGSGGGRSGGRGGSHRSSGGVRHGGGGRRR